MLAMSFAVGPFEEGIDQEIASQNAQRAEYNEGHDSLLPTLEVGSRHKKNKNKVGKKVTSASQGIHKEVFGESQGNRSSLGGGSVFCRPAVRATRQISARTCQPGRSEGDQSTRKPQPVQAALKPELPTHGTAVLRFALRALDTFLL